MHMRMKAYRAVLLAMLLLLLSAGLSLVARKYGYRAIS